MNNQEFETKILQIDTAEIIEKLRKLGAQETPEVLLRRYVFDMESENAEWVRLRTNGTKTTLTYKLKKMGNTEVGGTTEIEVEVSNFDKTAEILSKVPFKRVFYQENKTHIFTFNDIEFSIDTWPMMDPWLEIESTSKEKVTEGLQLLGLEGKDSGDKDIYDLYLEKGIDIHAQRDLKFS